MKKRVVILGGGESGTGAAILAKKKGWDVFLSDNGIIPNDYKALLINNDIEFEEKSHALEKILNAQQVIKSPGIPDNIELIKKIKKEGIPIISEIEFAAGYADATKIAITGSNGKTTTALLIHHILKSAGFNAALAGNVGQSFAKIVAEENNYDCYILEISSFQLDGMFNFKSDISILTNITPDHLDRYDNNFDNYIDSKFRIIRNQTKNDAFIYSADDPVIKEWIKTHDIVPSTYHYTLKNKPMKNGAWLDGKTIKIEINQNRFDMYLEKLALQGKHNTGNSMAAGIAAMLMKVRKESLRESLADFQNVEHRLEFVANVHGITFINDSKATNVNAAWFALECQNRPVIWIAGGIDKGNDYETIKPLIKEKVKAIVCLGKDNSKIVNAFSQEIKEIVETASANDAVKAAYSLADTGDIILLSPACASFDLFKNYEDRGDQFKKAVKEL